MEQAQDVRLSISAGQANRAWQAGFPTVSSFDPRWMWIDAQTAFPRDARSKRTSHCLRRRLQARATNL